MTSTIQITQSFKHIIDRKETMKYDREDAMKFIDILQTNITRMASCSAQCKKWALTITCALIVMLMKGETNISVKRHWGLVAIAPILFWFLDAYYLYLEKVFRKIYDKYISSLQQEEGIPTDTYCIKMSGHWKTTGLTLVTMFTTSILPFYAALLVAALIVSAKF